MQAAKPKKSISSQNPKATGNSDTFPAMAKQEKTKNSLSKVTSASTSKQKTKALKSPSLSTTPAQANLVTNKTSLQTANTTSMNGSLMTSHNGPAGQVATVNSTCSPSQSTPSSSMATTKRQSFSIPSLTTQQVLSLK